MSEPVTADPVTSLADALVESNDRLVALYDLIGLQSGSLDEDRDIPAILSVGAAAAGLDWLHLSDVSGREWVVGSGPELPWLRQLARAFRESGGPAQVDNSDGVHAMAAAIVSTPATTPAQASRLSVTNVSSAADSRRTNSRGTESANADVVVVGARRSAQRFTTPERRLVMAIGQAASAALRTAALHRAGVAKAEHLRAAQLAQMVLPTSPPAMRGLDVYAATVPARAAGGDFFASWEGPEWFHFMTGDVSGKGLPAALMMASLVSAAGVAMRNLGHLGPGHVLAAIDAATFPYLERSSLFATAVVGRIHPQTGIVEAANAGHDPVFVSRANGVVETLRAATPPLGVVPLPAVNPSSTVLSHGDICVVGSDGLTEQTNHDAAMFGNEALEYVVSQHRDGNAAQVAEAVLGALDAHAAGVAQEDDRTIAVLRWVDIL